MEGYRMRDVLIVKMISETILDIKSIYEDLSRTSRYSDLTSQLQNTLMDFMEKSPDFKVNDEKKEVKVTIDPKHLDIKVKDLKKQSSHSEA